MSKKLFTKKEIEILSKNPYVKHVSEKGITYTKEFKQIFIKEYNTGLYTSTMIFEKYGLSKNILGKDRILSSAKRWKSQYKRLDGLEDTRTTSSGRPRIYPLTKDEEIARLKEKNKRLEQENIFLKKIQLLIRTESNAQNQEDSNL